MMVLCSNCHILFTRNCLRIDLENKKVYHIDSKDPLNGINITLLHTIGQKYVDYNNKLVSSKNKNN